MKESRLTWFGHIMRRRIEAIKADMKINIEDQKRDNWV